MKYLFIASLSLFSLIACHKGTHTLNPNGDTLIGISVDTAGVYGFNYTGGQITAIANGLPGSGAATFTTVQYPQNDSFIGVQLNFNDAGFGTLTYALNADKLPIWFGWSQSNDPQQNGQAGEFVYIPGTDMLDSAQLYSWGSTFTYKFTYTGKDITQINEIYQGTSLGVFQFGYGGSANIFRATDSLFYVYAYPITVAGEQDVIIAAFFVETFSAHTFNKLTAINSYEFGSFSSNMTYTVNQDGKITSENFAPTQYGELAAKNFYYK